MASPFGAAGPTVMAAPKRVGMREQSRKVVETALSEGDAANAAEIAEAVENAIFEKHPDEKSKEYRSKIRVVQTALKGTRSQNLRLAVCSGEVTPSDLISLDAKTLEAKAAASAKSVKSKVDGNTSGNPWTHQLGNTFPPAPVPQPLEHLNSDVGGAVLPPAIPPEATLPEAASQDVGGPVVPPALPPEPVLEPVPEPVTEPPTAVPEEPDIHEGNGIGRPVSPSLPSLIADTLGTQGAMQPLEAAVETLNPLNSLGAPRQVEVPQTLQPPQSFGDVPEGRSVKPPAPLVSTPPQQVAALREALQPLQAAQPKAGVLASACEPSHDFGRARAPVASSQIVETTNGSTKAQALEKLRAARDSAKQLRAKQPPRRFGGSGCSGYSSRAISESGTRGPRSEISDMDAYELTAFQQGLLQNMQDANALQASAAAAELAERVRDLERQLQEAREATTQREQQENERRRQQEIEQIRATPQTPSVEELEDIRKQLVEERRIAAEKAAVAASAEARAGEAKLKLEEMEKKNNELQEQQGALRGQCASQEVVRSQLEEALSEHEKMKDVKVQLERERDECARTAEELKKERDDLNHRLSEAPSDAAFAEVQKAMKAASEAQAKLTAAEEAQAAAQEQALQVQRAEQIAAERVLQAERAAEQRHRKEAATHAEDVRRMQLRQDTLQSSVESLTRELESLRTQRRSKVLGLLERSQKTMQEPKESLRVGRASSASARRVGFSPVGDGEVTRNLPKRSSLKSVDTSGPFPGVMSAPAPPPSVQSGVIPIEPASIQPEFTQPAQATVVPTVVPSVVPPVSQPVVLSSQNSGPPQSSSTQVGGGFFDDSGPHEGPSEFFTATSATVAVAPAPASLDAQATAVTDAFGLAAVAPPSTQQLQSASSHVGHSKTLEVPASGTSGVSELFGNGGAVDFFATMSAPNVEGSELFQEGSIPARDPPNVFDGSSTFTAHTTHGSSQATEASVSGPTSYPLAHASSVTDAFGIQSRVSERVDPAVSDFFGDTSLPPGTSDFFAGFEARAAQEPLPTPATSGISAVPPWSSPQVSVSQSFGEPSVNSAPATLASDGGVSGFFSEVATDDSWMTGGGPGLTAPAQHSGASSHPSPEKNVVSDLFGGTPAQPDLFGRGGGTNFAPHDLPQVASASFGGASLAQQGSGVSDLFGGDDSAASAWFGGSQSSLMQQVAPLSQVGSTTTVGSASAATNVANNIAESFGVSSFHAPVQASFNPAPAHHFSKTPVPGDVSSLF